LIIIIILILIKTIKFIIQIIIFLILLIIKIKIFINHNNNIFNINNIKSKNTYNTNNNNFKIKTLISTDLSIAIPKGTYIRIGKSHFVRFNLCLVLFLKLSFVDYRGDGVIDADYKCPVISWKSRILMQL
jgi:hypothetical protein